MIDKIWLFSMRFCSGMCHQKMERSFFVKNYQLPVCARCTGLLIGYILGIIGLMFSLKLPIFLAILFIIIMFIDGFIQLKGIKQSNNVRRVITGTLCGIAVISVLYYIFIWIASLF